MKRTLFIYALVVLTAGSASLLTPRAAGAQAGNCGSQQEQASLKQPDDLHCSTVHCSRSCPTQGFTPARTFILCAVSVHVRALAIGPDETPRTLVLDMCQGSKCDPLAALIQTGTVALDNGESHRWYTFSGLKSLDGTPVQLNAGTTYTIGLSVNDLCCGLNCLDPCPAGRAVAWCFANNNHYAGGVGQCHVDPPGNLVDPDFLFIVYGVVKTPPPEPDGPYGARHAGNIGVGTSGPIGPGFSGTIAVQTPTAIDLVKGTTTTTINLMSGTGAIQVGPDVKGVSDFTISQMQGQFAPYSFGGTPVGISDFKLLQSGAGSIQWSNGELVYEAPVIVQAAGFLPVRATAHGSGRIVSPTQVELHDDCLALEDLSVVIPGITIPGLLLIAIALTVTGFVVLRGVRKKARPSAV